MSKLPEAPDIADLFDAKPQFDRMSAPSPVSWWAASNAAAVTVLVLDFATGYTSKILLPASGAATRLFPQGMAVREPMLLNLSPANFEFGFGSNIIYGDGSSAFRVPGGQCWTKYGLSTASAIAAALLGTVNIQDGITGALAAVVQPTDLFAAPGATALEVIDFMMAFNGASWDRLRTATSAVLGSFLPASALLVAVSGDWAINNAPAANAAATITRAAVAATRHICTSIAASIVAGAVAPGAAVVQVVLRDGVSGVGAILWTEQLSLQAVAGDRDNVLLSGLNIVGTAGNAMTLEFTAAGGANTTEVVSLTGHEAT